jgi:hypothetical protein
VQWLESLDNAFPAARTPCRSPSEQERLMLPHQKDAPPAYWSAAVKLVQDHLDRVSG